MLQTLSIPSSPLPEVPSAPSGVPGDAGERAEFAQLLREAKTIEPEAGHDEPTGLPAKHTRTDTRLRPGIAHSAQQPKAHDTRHAATDVEAAAETIDLAHDVKHEALSDASAPEVEEPKHPVPMHDDTHAAAPAADPALPVLTQVSERLQAHASQLPPQAMADERNLGARLPQRTGTRELRVPAHADAITTPAAVNGATAGSAAADTALSHTKDAAFDLALRQASGGRSTSAPLFERLPLESTPVVAQAAAFARELQQAQTGHTDAVAEATLHAAVDDAAFAPALGAQVTLWVKDGVQEARLQLHPAELGPVTVQIALDGLAAHVDFTAAVAATRESIEQSLPALAAALRESGFTLAGGGVFGRSGQGANESGRERPQEGRGHGARGTAAIGSDGAGEDATLRPRRWSRSLVDIYA